MTQSKVVLFTGNNEQTFNEVEDATISEQSGVLTFIYDGKRYQTSVPYIVTEHWTR
jgi:hypothetical protein